MSTRNALIACVGVAGLVGFARPAAAKFSPYLTSIEAGAGVASFAKGAARQNSDPGGTMAVRATIGTRSPIAFEVGYLGTVAEEKTRGTPDRAGVGTQTVAGSARLNLSLWRVQPFVTGGLGWKNLHSYGRDEAPEADRNFGHNTNSLVIPVGGGVASYIGSHGLIDARFNYELVTNKSFTPYHERPDMWNATINGGYAF